MPIRTFDAAAQTVHHVCSHCGHERPALSLAQTEVRHGVAVIACPNCPSVEVFMNTHEAGEVERCETESASHLQVSAQHTADAKEARTRASEHRKIAAIARKAAARGEQTEEERDEHLRVAEVHRQGAEAYDTAAQTFDGLAAHHTQQSAAYQDRATQIANGRLLNAHHGVQRA